MNRVITKTVEVPVPVVERTEVEKIVIEKEVEFVDRPVVVCFIYLRYPHNVHVYSVFTHTCTLTPYTWHLCVCVDDRWRNW